MNLSDIKPGMRLATIEVWEVVRAASSGEVYLGMVIRNERGNKFWARKVHPMIAEQRELICLDLVLWESNFEQYKDLKEAGLMDHLPSSPECLT